VPSLNENVVNELVQRGVINDTFRRLPPDKKDRVYRTALRLIGEYGYDGLSVDQLCTEAGISKGSFFQYFPSKSHLLEFSVFMFDDYLAEWVRLLRAKETAVHARDRLAYLFDAVVVNARLFPAEQLFFRYVTLAADHSAVAIEGISIERHLVGYLTEIITRGEATGEIRGDVDVTSTVEFVYATISGLIQRQYGGKKSVRSRTREYLVTILFDGIKR
jgi:TetR/AcrR family transcriptional regulator, fatty acid metabolism regulator protein